MIDAVPVVGAFGAALVLTWVVREFALRKNILDMPGARSMHSRPTPRGGGLAVVLVFFAFIVFAGGRSIIPMNLLLALGVGGGAIAVVGFLDDVFTLGNRVRMAVWIPAGVWAVYWTGGLPVFDIGVAKVPLGLAGSALAVIGVVWMINLYNFMDGIDGLAGGQAVVVGAGAGALLLVAGADVLATLALVLAAAAAGFLVWNWPPATIFMGDVCSGFIGYTIAVLALASDRAGAVPVAAWAALMAVFLLDATLTVIRRVKAGEPFHQAHRSHAYQRAVQFGRSHLQVTCAILAIDLILIGVAYMIWNRPRLTPLLLSAVVGLISILWWHYAVTLPKSAGIVSSTEVPQARGGQS